MKNKKAPSLLELQTAEAVLGSSSGSGGHPYFMHLSDEERFRRIHQNDHLINKDKKRMDFRKKYYERKKRLDAERHFLMQNDESYRNCQKAKTQLGVIISKIKRHFKNGHEISDKDILPIGCSIPFLIKHIESQFESWMSWKNYGRNGWHIDHIIPCADFDFSDTKSTIVCFNYSNLRPFRASSNIIKGRNSANSKYIEWHEKYLIRGEYEINENIPCPDDIVFRKITNEILRKASVSCLCGDITNGDDINVWSKNDIEQYKCGLIFFECKNCQKEWWASQVGGWQCREEAFYVLQEKIKQNKKVN